MYTFKVVVSVFLCILIILSGYAGVKSKSLYTALFMGIINALALVAIWT